MPGRSPRRGGRIAGGGGGPAPPVPAPALRRPVGFLFVGGGRGGGEWGDGPCQRARAQRDGEARVRSVSPSRLELPTSTHRLTAGNTRFGGEHHRRGQSLQGRGTHARAWRSTMVMMMKAVCFCVCIVEWSCERGRERVRGAEEGGGATLLEPSLSLPLSPRPPHRSSQAAFQSPLLSYWHASDPSSSIILARAAENAHSSRKRSLNRKAVALVAPPPPFVARARRDETIRSR